MSQQLITSTTTTTTSSDTNNNNSVSINNNQDIVHLAADSSLLRSRQCGVRKDYKSVTVEPEEESCSVCFSGVSYADSNPPNDIVFCDGCDSCFHQDCYGIKEVPENEWF